MQLVLDIGNTRNKAALYDKGRMLKWWPQPGEVAMPTDVLKSPIESLVWASVRQDQHTNDLVSTFLGQLQQQNKHTIVSFGIDQQTAVPFDNQYGTPQTLGIDRIAVVAAAYQLQRQVAQPPPPSAALIIDLGTCITTDILTAEGTYLGGSISPGWQMRLDAMHQLTARLPALRHHNNAASYQNKSRMTDVIDTESQPAISQEGSLLALPTVLGDSTANCMFSAAFWGIVYELNGYISHYQRRYNQLEVFVSGGDGPTFAPLLAAQVSVNQHLVLDGLNQIYLFNQRA
jgi:type III pantothenate kinase